MASNTGISGDSLRARENDVRDAKQGRGNRQAHAANRADESVKGTKKPREGLLQNQPSESGGDVDNMRPNRGSRRPRGPRAPHQKGYSPSPRAPASNTPR
eukprot:4557563-Pleurochrysis_carterae.AAC.1